MSTDLSTPVLLRRIAQLEATVVRLSEDLGSLRLAVIKQGVELPRARCVRARVAHPKSSTTNDHHSRCEPTLGRDPIRVAAAVQGVCQRHI